MNRDGPVQRCRSAPALRTLAWARPNCYALAMEQAAPTRLSLDEVRHVAKLARLRLNDEQIERYRAQLAAVLDHIAKLNELDVTDVEPMAHPTDLTNRIEDDVPMNAIPIDDLLRNAPAVEDHFLGVPKVLDEQ